MYKGISNDKSFKFFQIPDFFLKDKDFDVKAFPCLHPTGKFGLNHERDIKITSQLYFAQRLLHKNQMFAKSIPYLFMAHQFVEREMLQKQINVSGYKGALGPDSKVKQLTDPCSIFQKIKGSPKFWQMKRNELTAKVQQLGPFHVFFTLSCAEMRWAEVYLAVLRYMGIETLEVKHGRNGNWNGTDNDILVNGMPLWEYVKSRRESNSELLMNYIVLVTRIFDDRVKSFMKHMVMKNDLDEPNFKYYSYRIEFQARGLPHIHGKKFFFEISYSNIFLQSYSNIFLQSYSNIFLQFLFVRILLGVGIPLEDHVNASFGYL